MFCKRRETQLKKIIDLSHHNVVISWEDLKNFCDKVILRIGFRGYTSGKIAYDKKFREYLSAAKAVGIPVGFYFFPCSITDQEAIEEADFCAGAIAGEKTELPLFADSEISDAVHHAGRSDHLSKAQRTHLLNVFCSRLQEHGIPAGIYASTSWLNNNLDMTQLTYPVWVAQYGAQCTYKGKYMLWQYTSKAKVKGISGVCDMSSMESQNPYRKPTCLVKEGSSGVIVKWVQYELIQKGYVVTIDGQYGPKTKAAVVSFQRKNIKVLGEKGVDGIVGPHTLAIL